MIRAGLVALLLVCWGCSAAPAELDAQAPDPVARTPDASPHDGLSPDAVPPRDAASDGGAPFDLAVQDAQAVVPVAWLALGDSYTIGESVPAEGRWPVQLAERLNAAGVPVRPPQIIARTGWSVAQLLAAVAAEDPRGPFAMVTLLIGVNDQFRGGTAEAYTEAFTGALAEAIGRAGGRACRVVVLSIPDYGYTPFGARDQARTSAALDAFNAINRAQTAAAGAHYVDVTPISRRGLAEPALVAADGLHPSTAQYAEWAAAALPVAQEALRSCP
ncbi:MAG: hypothetical protein KC613_03965 [Myxococcales bacterium]|nr:hypothetical protein [Myxococcales bacterium]MCB9525254.1 SGNH/GDSL hydrolase family protein [Myxococcales bacterium]